MVVRALTPIASLVRRNNALSSALDGVLRPDHNRRIMRPLLCHPIGVVSGILNQGGVAVQLARALVRLYLYHVAPEYPSVSSGRIRSPIIHYSVFGATPVMFAATTVYGVHRPRDCPLNSFGDTERTNSRRQRREQRHAGGDYAQVCLQRGEEPEHRNRLRGKDEQKQSNDRRDT